MFEKAEYMQPVSRKLTKQELQNLIKFLTAKPTQNSKQKLDTKNNFENPNIQKAFIKHGLVDFLIGSLILIADNIGGQDSAKFSGDIANNIVLHQENSKGPHYRVLDKSNIKECAKWLKVLRKTSQICNVPILITYSINYKKNDNSVNINDIEKELLKYIDATIIINEDNILNIYLDNQMKSVKLNYLSKYRRYDN